MLLKFRSGFSPVWLGWFLSYCKTVNVHKFWEFDEVYETACGSGRKLLFTANYFRHRYYFCVGFGTRSIQWDFGVLWIEIKLEELFEFVWHCEIGSRSRVGFNVPPNTLQVISGMIFTGQMTQPTVSSTEGQQCEIGLCKSVCVLVPTRTQ